MEAKKHLKLEKSTLNKQKMRKNTKKLNEHTFFLYNSIHRCRHVLLYLVYGPPKNKHSLGKPIVHKTLVLSKPSCYGKTLSTNQRACLQNFNQSVSNKNRGKVEPELNKSTFV